MADYVGTVIGDRYELAAIIGRGGHGIVYRAVDRTSRRTVAVKMLSDSYANAPEYAARLAREQEALVALAGTSAVAVYDLCRAPNGAVCLVMEYLEGTDLERVLAEHEGRNERLPFPRFAAIMDPVVDTLEVAHDAKILHRDLKPANIFILSGGDGVRLFDFGLSRKMSSARLTHVGTVMGSPSYIAPEVWKGRSDDLDTRVDVYSLGVIVFRALSGRLPFEGVSLHQALVQATTAPRPSLHALRPDLPTSIDDWVQRALAIERDARFPSVTALWHGLFDALRAEPPRRARRPVTVSLVNAWRAAATAFRRFIPSGPATPAPEPRKPTMPPPSRPPDTDVIDDAWAELGDEDLLGTAPPGPNVADVDDGWEEVSQEELDRPSLFVSLGGTPPPEAPAAPAPEPPKARPKAAKKPRQRAAKKPATPRTKASATKTTKSAGAKPKAGVTANAKKPAKKKTAAAKKQGKKAKTTKP